MKIKIDGIAFFYLGFLLVVSLVIVGLYNFMGLSGIIFGAFCMLAGILLYHLGFYIDIDTTDEDDDENTDEKDIR